MHILTKFSGKLIKSLLFFFLFTLLLFFSKEKSFALVCQKDTSFYVCADQFAPPQGCTRLDTDCPTPPGSCFQPGASQKACYFCPSSRTWSCPDPVCGSALSCPRSYTWSTCGDTPDTCNTFTVTDSPACQCQKTCAESNGTCTFDSQCQSGTSEIFGAICSDANQICCTKPTPTPTPVPTFCAPNTSISCTTNDGCTGTQTCNSSGTAYGACVKSNPACPTPTPTPAPIGCQKDAASAVGCEVGCKFVNGIKYKCHIYNRNLQNVCDTKCTARVGVAEWNCVIDPITCPQPATPTPTPNPCGPGWTIGAIKTTCVKNACTLK